MSTFGRKKLRIPIAVPVGLIVVFIGLAWFFWPTEDVYDRQTIVLAAHPVTVISYSPREKSLMTIALPADIASEGTHGFGTYSLEAFWRLGNIDPKDGTVLSESISEALGIPVGGYFGPKNGELADVEPDSLAKNTFSFSRFGTFLTRSRTNIPLGQFVRLAIAFHFSRIEHTKFIDLRTRYQAFTDDLTLPDGSHQFTVNPQKIDILLRGIFEDERARRDAVTVAVYNTTSLGSLGTRVARVLTNAGISVVTVGNDMPEVGACTLTGQKSALESYSGRIIVSMLGCTAVESSGADRADLLLRVGSAYRKRFERRM